MSVSLRDILPNLKRFDAETLLNTFLGLAPREQIVAGVSALGVLVLIFIVPLAIANSFLGGFEEDIAAAQERMNKGVQLIQQYNQVRASTQNFEQLFTAQSADSIITAIQRVANDAQITLQPPPAERGKESFDIYEEEKAGFKLKGTTLEQTVKLLQGLEGATQRIMRVRELVLSPTYGNRQQLDAEFKDVTAYRLVGEEKRAAPKSPKGGS